MTIKRSDFPCRKLRANHKINLPINVLYYDSETRIRKDDNEEHHRMDLAWSCSVRYDDKGKPIKEKWDFWNNAKQFNHYLDQSCKSKRPLWVFGHNIFFDLQVSDFFYFFQKWGWILDFVYESGLTYILTARKGDRVIKCLSTTNWFDTSLKGLGDMLGLPKLDVDFGKSTRDEITTYCKRDVEIIKLAMESYFAFILKHDLGQFGMTKASQAFHAFRHRFMFDRLYPHDVAHVHGLERDGYFGGRVECFKLGKIKNGPFTSLDVNSMYPFIMRSAYLPVKLLAYEKGYPIDKLSKVIEKFCVMVRLSVDTEDPIYPYRRDNKIIFPVGRFATVLSTEGVREALKRDHIKDIQEIAIYRRAIIFREYVDYFYPLKSSYKASNQDVMAYFIKMMLNSLYGKFAQKKPIIIEDRVEMTEGYFREEVNSLVTGEKGVCYMMLNRYVEEYGFEEGNNSMVAISAHITEAARLLLWHIIESTGRERILYCDTDSVKLRSKDVKYVDYPIDNKILGALSMENEFDYFEIWGAKSYFTENIRKLKGVPLKAKELKPGSYQYKTFLRQKNHMKRQIIRFYVLRDTIKTIKKEYDKGVVDSKGNIYPIRL